ncbi:response regulator transcription factor [Knoellia sinensis]|uniref:response regulator transcription factor n=1 Tax=Knoellia sinensis TaxID=136100 RepID=UPI000690FEAF|nr:response regulator transcription factor [Knoellia sinensis]
MVDDHRTFTDLVCLALGGEHDLVCAGSAHTSAEARRLVALEAPDVVLMDVDLGGENGLDLTEELTASHPGLLVVVLTANADASVMRRAAVVGACALLPKDGSLPDLLGGLRHATRGSFYVHPRLLRTLMAEQDPARRTSPVPSLTARETHVLRLLAEGRHVSDIARELGISVHTCRGYVKALLAKLGAHSQLEAVVAAGAFGLLDAPPRH